MRINKLLSIDDYDGAYDVLGTRQTIKTNDGLMTGKTKLQSLVGKAKLMESFYLDVRMDCTKITHSSILQLDYHFIHRGKPGNVKTKPVDIYDAGRYHPMTHMKILSGDFISGVQLHMVRIDPTINSKRLLCAFNDVIGQKSFVHKAQDIIKAQYQDGSKQRLLYGLGGLMTNDCDMELMRQCYVYAEPMGMGGDIALRVYMDTQLPSTGPGPIRTIVQGAKTLCPEEPLPTSSLYDDINNGVIKVYYDQNVHTQLELLKRTQYESFHCRSMGHGLLRIYFKVKTPGG